MNFCQDRNKLLEKKWTDQSSRYRKKLFPESFRIDEKTLSDFAAFGAEFGKLISFFNAGNRPDGDWSSFFKDDPTIALLFLQGLNTEKWSAQNSETIRLFERSKKEEGKLEALKQLVILSTGIFTEIEQAVVNIHPHKDFHEQLIKYINTRFSPFFQVIMESNKILRETYDWKNPLSRNFDISFGTYWFSDKAYSYTETEDWIGSATLTIGKILPKIIHDVSILRKETNSFLNEEVLKSGQVKPHIALFIAFCDLYKHAQRKINKISERHLQHYYEEILQLKPRQGNKDSAYVTIRTINGADTIELTPDTKFTYLDDKSGSPEYFDLDHPLAVHEGNITEIKAVNVSSLPWLGSFMNRRVSNVSIFDLFYAGKHNYELGFEISSDYLLLEEGDRRVTFYFSLNRLETIHLKEKWKNHLLQFSEDDLNVMIANSWSAFYSNPAGAVPLEEKSLNVFFQSDGTSETYELVFDVLIKKHQPAFISGDPEDPSKAPVLRFVLNARGSQLYTLFRDISFSSGRLAVEAIGIKDLIIQNDFGILENGHPFEPFGARPIVGSNLYIGHKNLFLKPLTDLVVNLEWNNLPPDANGFKEYYKDYENIDDNSSFKISLSSLKDKNWVPSENRQVIDLFTGVPTDTSLFDNALSTVRRMNEIDISSLQLNSEARSSGPLLEYDLSSTDGFIKMELCYPEQGFGHDQYRELVQRSAFKAAKDKNEPVVINEPYTPSLKSISIEYKSTIPIKQWSEKISLKKIFPFGSELQENSKSWSLLPYFPDGGSFFIGLDPLLSNKELSFLFKISNRNITRNADNAATFNMSVLEGTTWQSLSAERISHDSTQQFQRTGLLKIKLPQIDPTGNLIDGTNIWLRFDFPDEYISYFIEDIHLNAGLVTRERPLEASSEPAKEYSIHALKDPILQIEKIEQPYRSFGGKKPETSYEFWLRTSERIHHKGRAVSNKDIEQLLLSRFPEIQSLKCLNHMDAALNFQPGTITIAVIPSENDESGALERYFQKEKLMLMQEYLQTQALTGMKIFVVNPVYEKVRLKFNVKFREGYDEKSSFRKLHHKIMAFLDPWKSYKIINQGGVIPITTILNEIELEEYVDFVTNFSVFHMVNDQIINLGGSQNNEQVITAKSPVSVLIPDVHHKLLSYNDEISTDKPGINDMMIGNDFLVHAKTTQASSGLGFDTIEKTFRVLPETDQKTAEKQTYTMYLKD